MGCWGAGLRRRHRAGRGAERLDGSGLDRRYIATMSMGAQSGEKGEGARGRPTVDVALPVHRHAATLAEAVSSLAAQTLGSRARGRGSGRELGRVRVWIVLNGSDEATRSEAVRIARETGAAGGGGGGGGGIAVVLRELERPSLAAAVNLVLRESDAEYVARMDADDFCEPQRLAAQVDAMEREPSACACFTAWDTRDASGAIVETRSSVIAPTHAPWRLLLENPYAHGSAMLRRRRVLEVGGYDERFVRAQDYDLWLRLAGRGPLIVLPEVMYHHRIRHGGWGGGGGGGGGASGLDAARVQAEWAARARARALDALPTRARGRGASAVDAVREMNAVDGTDAVAAALARIEASVAVGELDASDDAGLAALIDRLIEAQAAGGVRGSERDPERAADAARPTREAAMTLLWARGFVRARADAAQRACFGARVREVLAAMRDAGVARVVVFGAGRHTRRLLAAWPQDEVQHWPRVRIVVDDRPPCETLEARGGATIDVRGPEAIHAGEDILISSDAHEEALAARAREVAPASRVWRLYGEA